MLLEILDMIGEDNIERTLSEADIKNTILILIDKTTFKIVDIGAEFLMSDIDDVDYAKERIFYSDYITSNKSVVMGKSQGEPQIAYKTTKIVTTANKYSICFNIKTFKAKLLESKSEFFEKPNELLEAIICEYCDAILRYTNTSKEEEELYLKHKDEILDITLKNIDSSKKIRIMIQSSLDNYKREFDGYFSEKIFDKKIDDEMGVMSAFSTINGKKPLLTQHSSLCNLPILYNYTDAVKLYKLKFYMDKKFKTKNNLSLSEDSSEVYIGYNPSDKAITDFDINPYLVESDKELLTLAIEPVLSQCNTEYTITTHNALARTLDILSGYALRRENKTDSGKKKIYNLYNKVLLDSFERDDDVVYIADKDFLEANLLKILDCIIDNNRVDKSSNKDGYFRMSNLINFRLFAEDFVKKGDGKMIKDIKGVKKSFSQKIIDYKDIPNLDSTEEAMFAAGQLAFAINARTKGKLNASLVTKYTNAKTTNRLLQMLSIDIKKYDHSISVYGRELKMYALIQEKLLESGITRFDRQLMSWFEIGLYGDNYFFVKGKDTPKQD